ncbi:alpha/beta fold hydrolase [Clavibacter michiganensis]|nr:alpha/beta fold hydrolase [Clavibacter michiganensis]
MTARSQKVSTSIRGAFRSRKRLIAMAVVIVVLLGWGVYKVSSTRHLGSAMVADDSCRAEPATVAQMSNLIPGAESIHCESWDIGTGVTGYSWQAPNPRGVVLFQHGWGDYAQRWVRQADQLIPHLLAEGFSVYAFDMWGNGRSPGQRGLVDVEQAVTDHLAARQKLRSQPLPVFLMGHSLGGLVTATSTARDQDGLAGVVLLAPAVKYDINTATRALVRVGAFVIPTLPAPLGEPKAVSGDATFLQKFSEDPLATTEGVSWLTAAGGATVSRANMRLYPSVGVPVLAVHGSADGSTDPSGSSDLVDALASTDKTFVSIEGGRHALLDDTSADETLGLVLDWLRTRVAARGE